MLRSSSSTREKRFNLFGGRRSPSPPPLPGYNSNSTSKRKRKSSRPPHGINLFIESKMPHTLQRSFSRHPSALWTVLGLIFVFCLAIWLLNNALILFKFKIQNRIISSGWSGSGMKIRKAPLIFVHSSQSAAIVWETNKMVTSGGNQVALRYWTIGVSRMNATENLKSSSSNTLKMATGKVAEVKRTKPDGDDGSRRWIHSSLLEGLVPGTIYGYEIVLVNPHQDSHGSYRQFESIKKVYSSHKFTWLGIDPPDMTQIQHLSSTSPSSQNPIDLMHIVVIGDNQFGVKVFKKLAQRFMNIKSYAPKFKSIFGPRQIIHHLYPPPTKPSLIFHLGDAVQHAGNLKQWQTDFWDPLTFKNKLTSEIPIVYARGNHDFDMIGHNYYAGGIPKVQIGEMNRTQTQKLPSESKLEIPGIAEADRSFTTIKNHERDPNSRGTYFAYSPHPRVRVLVCDSNLEPSRKAYPGSSMSEVDEHERWLLWEMARPEWKEASIRIIMVHVPPFVEYWDKTMWTEGHESAWGQYVRTRFAAHFHGTSILTRRYDIPAASIVISGHSHSYSRGYLASFVSESFFAPRPSSEIPRDVIKSARMESRNKNDVNNPHADHGVVYVVSGGAGGVLDKERVENWGFYERSIKGKHHFGYMMLDMSETLLSIEEWGQDWQDSRDKRKGFLERNIRVYKLVGSQLVCKGTNDSWEAGHYQAIDRLIWTSVDINGKIIDRFVIEADSCR